jgi:hypothetical protein
LITYCAFFGLAEEGSGEGNDVNMMQTEVDSYCHGIKLVCAVITPFLWGVLRPTMKSENLLIFHHPPAKQKKLFLVFLCFSL